MVSLTFFKFKDFFFVLKFLYFFIISIDHNQQHFCVIRITIHTPFQRDKNNGFCVNEALRFQTFISYKKKWKKEKTLFVTVCATYITCKLTYCILFPLFNQKTNWCCLQYIIVICAGVLIYVRYFTACAHTYHVCIRKQYHPKRKL